ncbi:MAG: TVP38/TMEM64 family protein, partial [Caldilinea sp.]|nr:TVP38/TMEM64 family protein [Caldilinea sp.]
MFLLLAAVGLLIWWLTEPVSDALAAAGDIRAWIISTGPMAPIAYVTFFAAQILIAPLPGSFLAVLGGYLFGFGAGLFLSLLGLAIGASLVLLIGRKLGRPLLERFFDRSDLIRWERKLRLRSPLIWFVLFLFPVPDVVMYVAGMGTTPLRWLLPAILLGRSLGIFIG